MYGLSRMIPMMACALAPVVVGFYQASVSSTVCRSSQTTLDHRDVVEKTLHLCIRTFQILRKATNSAECCLFRRFCKISAVFLFRRTVLNTRPRRFDRIFAKGQAASTIFRREYAARGLGARAKASKSRAGGGEAGWCDGSRRAGELTPGSTRVKKPKSWRSACAL
jgi:hypothetical protein